MWWPETGLNRRRRPFQGRALPLSYLASVQTSVASLRVESGRGRKRREHPRTVRCNNFNSIPTPILHAKPAAHATATSLPSIEISTPRPSLLYTGRQSCAVLPALSPASLVAASRHRLHVADARSTRSAPEARAARAYQAAVQAGPLALRAFLADFPRAPTCTFTFPARSMRRPLSATPAKTACASTPRPSTSPSLPASRRWSRQPALRQHEHRQSGPL